ncbi:RNA polymerase sigma factor [Calidifontibacter terrae]
MTATAPAGSLTARAGVAHAAYLAGDEQRLGELVELLTPVLWHTARAQGATASTAEEAVQTAWLKLVEYGDRMREPAAVLGWMVTTVKRECWRQVDRQRRDTALDERPEPQDAVSAPDAEVILADQQRVLWQHVQQLSPRCRELLRVVAFGDRADYAALAAALGMPIGSIGPTRGRCLTKLRTALGADPRWEP